MTKKISIAIDAMGGDNAPDKTIQGIKIFIPAIVLSGELSPPIASIAIEIFLDIILN